MGIFGMPEDYSEMLSKIGFFTFFASLLSIAIMDSAAEFNVPYIELLSIKVDFEIFESIPLWWLGYALLITLLSSMVKLHDRISDALRIRSNFDHNHILVPLAIGSGRKLNIDDLEKLKQKRNVLMRRIFYKYASSKTPQIDKHEVVMALNNWTWYWIFIETIVVLLIAVFLTMLFEMFQYSAWFAIAILVLLLVSHLWKGFCNKHAKIQVQEILSVEERRVEIAEELNAL